MVDTGARLLPQEGEAIVASIAGMLGTQIDSEHPIIEAELPLDGSRIEGLVPPLVASPSFAINKRATRVFPLSHYIETGSMTPRQAEVLRASIAERHNIVVSGGTGSGKTTLVNAILDEMVRLGEPSERFVLLEDTVELASPGRDSGELRCERLGPSKMACMEFVGPPCLRPQIPGAGPHPNPDPGCSCSAENYTALRTSRHVELATLVKATMRLNPDRIIIGEVRGREALDLPKAWNTGHPGGCTTVHANNAAAALSRLDQLAQEAGVPSQRSLIAETVGLVIHIEGGSRGRIGGKEAQHGFREALYFAEETCFQRFTERRVSALYERTKLGEGPVRVREPPTGSGLSRHASDRGASGGKPKRSVVVGSTKRLFASPQELSISSRHSSIGDRLGAT